MPTVQPFMGICTLKNVPIKFTANRAQTPCKAVRRRAVKNLFDLTDVIKIMIRYKEKTIPKNTFADCIAVPPEKNLDILFLLFLRLNYSSKEYNRQR